MIKLEHIVLASPEQMEFIIEGMRNPMNSWEKSDSSCGTATRDTNVQWDDNYFIGTNDAALMQRLASAGTDHRKFTRMMPVYVRITAPLYWWKEFDTYKVGTVTNSCSTMHKIAAREFALDDFSHDHLTPRFRNMLMETIDELNYLRDKYNHFDAEKEMSMKAGYICDSKKDVGWQIIQLLPSSYNQTRNVMMNYEVLANIYKSRRGHKLDEWVDFCKWIESLPYSELIRKSTEE